MTLPSESLGVVAYAADNLRIEPVPDRELAGDSILWGPMVLGHEVVGTPSTGRTCHLGSTARFPHTDGTFVNYATLPSRMLRRLQAGLRLRDAERLTSAATASHCCHSHIGLGLVEHISSKGTHS
jgi:L-idonate 5-dehydrogenase